MNEFASNDLPDKVKDQAAAWVLRSDRGLSAGEQDALSAWLAADPKHGAALALHRMHWRQLDRLVQWRPEHSSRPNPDLLATLPPKRNRRPPVVWAAYAAAATLVIGGLIGWILLQSASHPEMAASDELLDRHLALDDGSIVDLNRDAELVVEFTPAERRVHLKQGEAFFAVAKDPQRPFVVSAQGVDLRALGTAFNVRVEAAAVEVLVTEGHVEVRSPPDALQAVSTASGEIPPVVSAPVLEANQRAVVSLVSDRPLPQIATLTAGEIERVLAWQHRLMEFVDVPLDEAVAQFNRANRQRIIVGDAELASFRISGTIRSDNLEGFLALLTSGFGAQVERVGENEIILRRTVTHRE